MKRILLLCSAFVLLTVSASAQKQKTWTEWSEKDAIKVMTDSAWAQTQKETTDTDVPTGPGNSAAQTRSATGREEKNAQSGETLGRKNMPLTLNYSIAFLSAKPVRQAFVRYMEIKSPETPADQAAQRRAFIDLDFGDFIVVTLKLEGTDQSKLKPALKLLSEVSSAVLEMKPWSISALLLSHWRCAMSICALAESACSCACLRRACDSYGSTRAITWPARIP